MTDLEVIADAARILTEQARRLREATCPNTAVQLEGIASGLARIVADEQRLTGS